MIPILPRFIAKKFTGLVFFCLLSVAILFVIVDLVELMDTFIDKKIPFPIILQYYSYYIIYILVLVTPVATLLATVFSIGSMARNNEILALKALGYSLYQILVTLLVLGAAVSVVSFFTSEVLVAETSDRRSAIEQEYGITRPGQRRPSSRMVNLEIRDQDRLITMGQYHDKRDLATRIKIERLDQGRIVERIDADSMAFTHGRWVIWQGYQRQFSGDEERAVRIKDTLDIGLQLSPRELKRAQGLPENMGYWDLRRYVQLLRRNGSDVHAFVTELHLRISFPLSNMIIVLFALPMAYNRRKKNLAVGFGISLSVCFFYFGIVKLGQTMGHQGSISPLLGAWLGNGVMVAGSVVNMIKTRK